MQLRYRGITYQSNNTQVETIPSDISAQFLGRTYSVNRPTQIFKPIFKPELGFKTYRGISYTK